MSQVLVSSSSTQSAMEHQYGGWSRLSWRYANFVSWVKTLYKLDVPQSLMLHDIVVKRKSILDQLRKGRSTLGVLAEIEDNPSLFEEFFVHQGGLSNDFVLKCLHFQDSCKQNVIEDRVYQMLQPFVTNQPLDELKNFLKFVTWTSEVSLSTLPHRISVSG